MKAIQTKYLGATNSKGSRNKRVSGMTRGNGKIRSFLLAVTAFILQWALFLLAYQFGG